MQRRHIVIVALVLALVLGACSAPATPTPAPAAAATDTPVPATDEPAPTSPPEATATAEPSAEPTVAPTQAEPTDTAEPTDVPEPTATPEPTVAPAAAQGECYNPFFPAEEGKVLRYRLTSPGSPPVEQVVRFTEVTEDSFVAEMEMTGETTVTSESKWLCTDEGIMSTEYAQLTAADMPEGLEFETLEFSGVSFLPPDQWEVGSTWDTNWKMAGTMTVPEAGSVKAEIDVQQTNTIAAIESVTVPAGTYPEAVRVDSTMDIAITAKMGGMTVPATTTTVNSSSWYVEGVGLVKNVSPDESGEATMELVAVE